MDHETDEAASAEGLDDLEVSDLDADAVAGGKKQQEEPAYRRLTT